MIERAASPASTPETVGWIASHENRPACRLVTGGDGRATPYTTEMQINTM